MANSILHDSEFYSQLITLLWKLGDAKMDVNPILAFFNDSFSSETEEGKEQILQILGFLLDSYRDLPDDDDKNLKNTLGDKSLKVTSNDKSLENTSNDKSLKVTSNDKSFENISYAYIKKGLDSLKEAFLTQVETNTASLDLNPKNKDGLNALKTDQSLPTVSKDPSEPKETDPLMKTPDHSESTDKTKVTESLAQALLSFQNKKQTTMRVIGGIFSFFYATFNALMNVAAFLAIFSFPLAWTWVCGTLIFTSGFGINLLGSYRVIPDMFSKAITYISNGCFWKSVFSYRDTNGQVKVLSPLKKGLLVTGFFASLGASFSTSFLATSSLSTVLISLHVISAAFPPLFAALCIVSFTLFMTPILTYAFSSLIKQDNVLSKTWDATKEFFKNIFSSSVEHNQGKGRARIIFEGICTIVLLGLAIFGLWAAMSSYNVSMNTILKGTFKVSEKIADGFSRVAGVVMNFAAQIPFVIETVNRTIHWICDKVTSWFCPTSVTPEEKEKKVQLSEEPRTMGEKIKRFFSTVWVWFSKIGSAIGEGLIAAIEGKGPQTYPAAFGEGVSAAASSNLDDELGDEGGKIHARLVEETTKKINPPPKENQASSTGLAQSLLGLPKASTPSGDRTSTPGAPEEKRANSTGLTSFLGLPKASNSSGDGTSTQTATTTSNQSKPMLTNACEAESFQNAKDQLKV